MGNWEGTQLGWLTPADPRDIPSHPIWHHAQHLELGEIGQGDVQSDGICLPQVIITCDGSWLSLGC